ncbi:MAG TPA: TolC family protein [Fimbriiglobus sp.]|jgi:outer membrane protein TolC
MSLRHLYNTWFIIAVLVAGCATPPVELADTTPTPTRPVSGATPAEPTRVDPEIRPAQATVDPTPPTPLPTAKPAYGASATLPIDLPTVFRLVNANSPAVGFARARVREAMARQDKAEVLWLPNLQTGAAYNRFDGQTQNQSGSVFGVSRSNLFGGGGTALAVDTAEAYYQPLVARQLTRAESFAAQGTTLTAQLDAALAYFDLLQAHALLAVNADTLARAEQMLKYAKNAQASQLSKTAGDVNRAQTEVYLRQQERLDLDGRAGAAAARLGRLLLLDPAVVLVPADPKVTALELIDPTKTLDDLVAISIANHPDLAANRALALAAWERVRKARNGMFLPKVALQEAVGSFGGGINADVSNFSARNALTVQLYWELENLGFGTAASLRAERAAYDQATYRVADAQARIAADVAEAARIAAAKAAGLDLARKAIGEAAELYRKLQESSFNMVGPKAQYDALEPLLAIQSLNQARTQYLTALIEYDKAQFRLFTALGHPAECTTR